MKSLNVLFFVSLFMGLSACHSTLEAMKAQQPDAPPASASEDGNSSGGGGFGDESSIQLLKWSQEIVSNGLKNSHPEVFKNLPSDWPVERLVKLVNSIHHEPKKVVYRYGRELMFDYVIPAQGEPYLIATSLFFRSYASIPLRGMPPANLEPYFRELRSRLLHEMAHVIGIGATEATDYKARVFADYMASLFARSNVLCEAKDVPEAYPYVVDKSEIDDSLEANKKYWPDQNSRNAALEKMQSAPYYWVVNRGTGFGLQMRKHYSPFTSARFFIDEIKIGNVVMASSFTFFPDRVRNITEFRERTRRYDEPLYSTDSVRVFQEYYRGGQSNDQISFTGSTGDIVYRNPNGDFICHAAESIEIPVKGKMSHEGKIHFDNTCKNIFDAEPKPLKGQFPVQCYESFDTFKYLEEFRSAEAFKSPELVELMPSDKLGE